MRINRAIMIELDFNIFNFKYKVIYYSDSIFDVDGYSSVSFKTIKNRDTIPLFICQEETHYCIDLTQSLEVIWNNMNRNARRNIKKAEQEGIAIKFNQGYPEFYEMYKHHLQTKKHIKWYNVYSLDVIKKHGVLVVAEYKNKIISGSIFLEDENNIVYWITASYRYDYGDDIKKLSAYATYLIQWEIIKYAKLKGLKEYNLGSCSYEDDVNLTLKQFKENLGGKEHVYYGYYKDYNKIYNLIRSFTRLTNGYHKKSL